MSTPPTGRRRLRIAAATLDIAACASFVCGSDSFESSCNRCQKLSGYNCSRMATAAPGSFVDLYRSPGHRAMVSPPSEPRHVMSGCNQCRSISMRRHCGEVSSQYHGGCRVVQNGVVGLSSIGLKITVSRVPAAPKVCHSRAFIAFPYLSGRGPSRVPSWLHSSFQQDHVCPRWGGEGGGVNRRIEVVKQPQIEVRWVRLLHALQQGALLPPIGD